MYPHAAGQQSLWATAAEPVPLEPVLWNKRSFREATWMRSPCTVTKESLLRALKTQPSQKKQKPVFLLLGGKQPGFLTCLGENNSIEPMSYESWVWIQEVWHALNHFLRNLQNHYINKPRLAGWKMSALVGLREVMPAKTSLHHSGHCWPDTWPQKHGRSQS